MRCQIVPEIPPTPNLLVSTDHRIKICDFGPYRPWQEEMEPSYRALLDRVSQ